MRRTAFFVAAVGFIGAAAVQGCGSDKVDDGANLPSRSPKDAGVITPDDSGGGSSGNVDCTGLTDKVSDTPACDTCAKQKCCKEVMACENSSDCKALNACLAKCADTDQLCILTCSAAHDNGTALAQDVASCAQDKCASECPTPEGGTDPFNDF